LIKVETTIQIEAFARIIYYFILGSKALELACMRSHASEKGE